MNDIQKAIDLWATYNDDNLRTIKLKRMQSITEKVRTITGWSFYSFSPRNTRVARYFKTVYNMYILQKSGTRTLVINDTEAITSAVSSTNYSDIELALIEIVCDIILAQSDFISARPENIDPASLTIADHLLRVFGYKTSTVNRVTEKRFLREFGYSTDLITLYYDTEIVLNVEIHYHGVLVHTVQGSFEAFNNRWIYSQKNKYARKAMWNSVWLYILQKLPTLIPFAKVPLTDTEKLEMIKNVLNSPYDYKYDEIKRIIARKYK